MLHKECHIRQVWQSGHYSVYSTHAGIIPGWMGIIFILTIWALDKMSCWCLCWIHQKHRRVISITRACWTASVKPCQHMKRQILDRKCLHCQVMWCMCYRCFSCFGTVRSVLVSAPPTGCPSEKTIKCASFLIQSVSRLVLLLRGSLL